MKLARILLSAVVAMLTIAPQVPALSHDDPYVPWANATYASAISVLDVRGVKPHLMKAEDRFAVDVAFGGLRAETACSGSRWVYDYKHHIAAGESGGPRMILYAPAPPVKLPSRDLSNVKTIHGLHLGSTPLQVTAALGVPPADVVQASPHSQYLYLEKDVHLGHDPHEFADIAIVMFEDGRAVSIWFAHDEN